MYKETLNLLSMLFIHQDMSRKLFFFSFVFARESIVAAAVAAATLSCNEHDGLSREVRLVAVRFREASLLLAVYLPCRCFHAWAALQDDTLKLCLASRTHPHWTVQTR